MGNGVWWMGWRSLCGRFMFPFELDHSYPRGCRPFNPLGWRENPVDPGMAAPGAAVWRAWAQQTSGDPPSIYGFQPWALALSRRALVTKWVLSRLLMSIKMHLLSASSSFKWGWGPLALGRCLVLSELRRQISEWRKVSPSPRPAHCPCHIPPPLPPSPPSVQELGIERPGTL